MIAAAAIAVITLALVPASLGTSATRPVALTASPAHVTLVGNGRATIRISNSGTRRVVADVTRAGFALDLRGRPRIMRGRIARSARTWLRLHPGRLGLRPGGSAVLTVSSKLPPRAEPGDHDALVLVTTRPRTDTGVAVRVRMGVVVVVRAPGRVVRRLALGRLRTVRRGRVRLLELVVVNGGNVTETLARRKAILTLSHGGRRLATLAARPRDLRPRSRGILQFRYRGHDRGAMFARVEIAGESGRDLVGRTYRIRL